MGPINGRRRRRLLLLAAVALTAGAAVDAQPDNFNLKNFNPSMAIVMVVLVTAFFMLGFFSIYLRRCAGPPLGGPDDGNSPVRLGLGLGNNYAPAARRMRGLDRAVLDAFPTMAYADVRAHKGALECAVCLSEFDDGDTLRLLPRCAHAFHADCIDAWLASHVTCPVCRAILAPDAEAAARATEHDQVIPVTATAAPDDHAVVDAAAGEAEDQRLRREEAAELLRIGSAKRALRSNNKSQFPRSHTTGHSLAAPSPSGSPSSTSDPDRYTLRLPDHVLREAVAAANLRRSASVQTGGHGTTTRRGFGIAGHYAGNGRSVRLGNSGRWPNMSLLLARTFSARRPAWGSVRRGEADADAPAPDKGAMVEQCHGGACSLV